jgi:cytoskeletal protein RodZ
MRALSAKSSSSRKRKVIIIAVILAVACGTGAYAYYAVKQQQQKNENTQRDASTVKEDQVKSETKAQESTSSPSQLPSKTGDNSQIPPPAETPSTPPEKPNIERAGGDPTIKVVATFQKASAGYCELQLSASDQQTKSFTSSIVVSASYYTCSFSIARSSLPVASWSAVIVHHIGSATTSSDVRSVN